MMNCLIVAFGGALGAVGYAAASIACGMAAVAVAGKMIG